MPARHSDPGCIFCKIVSGAIPASVILETDDALAFLDIRPVNRGHVLLVPREHHADLSELPETLAAHTGSLLPRLSRALMRTTGADGLNLIVNNGAAAGQTVFHGHWHLIPRWADDHVHWPWPHIQYEGDEHARLHAALKDALAGG